MITEYTGSLAEIAAELPDWVIVASLYIAADKADDAGMSVNAATFREAASRISERSLS